MTDPSDAEVPGVRRRAAELRLASRVQGLVAHELGNPLQSLVVFVELTRDELAARDPDDPGVARLDRALVAIDRFRDVLIDSGRVRRALFETEAEALTQRRWGPLLDELITVVAHRLRRVEFHRETQIVDERAMAPGLSTAAVLAALVGVAAQLRGIPPEGVRVALEARVDGDRVELSLGATQAGEPIPVDPALGDWIRDLLAESPACDVCVGDGTLILSSPLA